jgi:F0F1-type ATP synthase membrane subunit b/b'
MVMLVEEVVNLENEAESIIAHANAEMKQLEKVYEEKIAAYRQKMIEEMHEKIAEFQKNIEETHKAAIYEAERELKESIDALNSVSDDAFGAQVSLIVSRLCNV